MLLQIEHGTSLSGLVRVLHNVERSTKFVLVLLREANFSVAQNLFIKLASYGNLAYPDNT